MKYSSPRSSGLSTASLATIYLYIRSPGPQVEKIRTHSHMRLIFVAPRSTNVPWCPSGFVCSICKKQVEPACVASRAAQCSIFPAVAGSDGEREACRTHTRTVSRRAGGGHTSSGQSISEMRGSSERSRELPLSMFDCIFFSFSTDKRYEQYGNFSKKKNQLTFFDIAFFFQKTSNVERKKKTNDQCDRKNNMQTVATIREGIRKKNDTLRNPAATSRRGALHV